MRHFITALIIQPILDKIQKRNRKTKTRSIYHFDMRPYPDMAFIGVIGVVFIGAILVWAYLSEDRASWDSRFEFVIFSGLTVLVIMSVILILSTVKGFWDATVDGDKLMVRRLWLIKRSIDIHDIDHCMRNKGGIHVYRKGRKFASIDSMSSNLSNFEKRMEKEGIEIRYKKWYM